MKPPLFYLIVFTGIWVSSDVVVAADKIEISSIITTSDAETILEEPVKDMSHHGGDDEFKSH